MAATETSASFFCGHPLFCSDFDPFNDNYLVVAGGGGSTKAGVPNKIVRFSLSFSALNLICCVCI
jgi:hypothetical protein